METTTTENSPYSKTRIKKINQFVNPFVTAIMKGNLSEVKKIWRKHDGKKPTEKEIKLLKINSRKFRPTKSFSPRYEDEYDYTLTYMEEMDFDPLFEEYLDHPKFGSSRCSMKTHYMNHLYYRKNYEMDFAGCKYPLSYTWYLDYYLGVHDDSTE
jgi:hypothetical protein